jgi:hypothetical protein
VRTKAYLNPHISVTKVSRNIIHEGRSDSIYKRFWGI